MMHTSKPRTYTLSSQIVYKARSSKCSHKLDMEQLRADLTRMGSVHPKRENVEMRDEGIIRFWWEGCIPGDHLYRSLKKKIPPSQETMDELDIRNMTLFEIPTGSFNDPAGKKKTSPPPKRLAVKREPYEDRGYRRHSDLGSFYHPATPATTSSSTQLGSTSSSDALFDQATVILDQLDADLGVSKSTTIQPPIRVKPEPVDDVQIPPLKKRRIGDEVYEVDMVMDSDDDLASSRACSPLLPPPVKMESDDRAAMPWLSDVNAMAVGSENRWNSSSLKKRSAAEMEADGMPPPRPVRRESPPPPPGLRTKTRFSSSKPPVANPSYPTLPPPSFYDPNNPPPPLYTKKTQADALATELEDVRKAIRQGLAREKEIVQKLKEMGAEVPVDKKEESDFLLGERIALVQEELKEERRKRELAEGALMDVRRECREPFVVPALLDAFVLISARAAGPSA